MDDNIINDEAAIRALTAFVLPSEEEAWLYTRFGVCVSGVYADSQTIYSAAQSLGISYTEGKRLEKALLVSVEDYEVLRIRNKQTKIASTFVIIIAIVVIALGV